MKPSADRVLEQRLRERLGGRLFHPGGVEVSVINGRATLSGVVPQDEAKQIIRIASSVRGVHAIVDRMEMLAPGNGDAGAEQ